MAITITVAEVKALLKFASEDAARENLCGIAVSGQRLAATNGHVVAIRGEDPRASWSGALIVPTALWLQAIAGLKAGDQLEVDGDANLVTITGGPAPVQCRSPKRTFPPLDQVIPESSRKAANSIGVGGHYLALLPVIDKATRTKSGSWDMRCGGELDPILLVAQGRETTWTVIIMPVRL